MSNNKYTEDDYCDLIPGGKICDNCGKCLEEAGVDIRAIKIEDISKNVEENKFIEEELKKAMDTALDLHIESNEAEYSASFDSICKSRAVSIAFLSSSSINLFSSTFLDISSIFIALISTPASSKHLPQLSHIFPPGIKSQ